MASPQLSLLQKNAIITLNLETKHDGSSKFRIMLCVGETETETECEVECVFRGVRNVLLLKCFLIKLRNYSYL